MNHESKYELSPKYPGEPLSPENHMQEYDFITSCKTLAQLITVKDLSCIFSLSVSMIYKLVEEDRIPYYRLGRTVRFNPNEIKEWLAQQHSQPSHSTVNSVQLGKDIDNILKSTTIRANL